MKKLFSALAILMALAMILSGCASQATEAPEAPEAPEATTAAEPVADEPVVLVIGSNGGQLASMDRFANFGFVVDDTSGIFTDPLVSSDHHQNYQPALALEWAPSEDYISWTFTLRQGVKFHSGNDFTSADVKFTFERLITDKTLTDVGSWGNLDHVDTPDTYTAVVVLKGVAPTFLDEVGRVYILDSKAYEADPANYFYLPSGTGAFQVTAFDKQSGEVRYQRNDDWWGWTTENKTNVDELIYKYIGDDTTRASALQAGDIDIATQLTMDYKDTLDPSEYSLQMIKSDAHFHIQFNCAEGKLFNDRNLRQALSLSIDRQALVDSIFGEGASVATFAVPEGNLGFDAGTQYAYDLDQAKQLVEASGYAGEEIGMIISISTGSTLEIAQVIQAMAAQAGLNIKLEPLEQATFMDRRFAGEFDMTFGSFAATAGDPQVEVGVIIAFDVFKSNYVNEEMHNLAVSTHGLTDRAARGEVLKQVFLMEMEEFAPFVYLYSPVMLYATQSNISNYEVYADGSANYKLVQKQP